MHFQKKQVGKSSVVIKLLIKIVVLLLILFFLFVLVNKINFPYPHKKIEKIISDETFKVLK